MLLTIVTFIIVLSILVFVHELGHFWTARRFGVKAEEFGFGFPPRAIGVYKDTAGNWKKVVGGQEVNDASDTVYSINWIPLGGFVKIKGEDGEDRASVDSFANKKIWQRTIILSAGVTMNVFLAAFLISIGLMVGLPQVIDSGISSKAQITDKKIQIIKILEDSPAKLAGLQLSDVVVSINNIKFSSDEDLQNYVADKAGQPLDYNIIRGGEVFEYKITPEILKETNSGGIGIAVANTGLVRYPFFSAILEGVKTTIFLTWAIITAFFDLIKGLILGNGVSVDLGGPIRIAEITGQAARMGFVYILQFTALLSINLAVINFLPFPALDGGRVLFLIIEKIKGSPVKKEIEATIHNAGFILLMVLVSLVTIRDVSRFADTFKLLWQRIF